MHQSQSHIILRRALHTLWQHVFWLFTTSLFLFVFFSSSSPLLLLQRWSSSTGINGSILFLCGTAQLDVTITDTVRWRGGMLGKELLVHCNWTQSWGLAGGQSLTYVSVHACVCSPAYIFACVHVCTGTFAIAAMEGTDGRGKWTPVPEEYCGAEDQSAAYVPPWPLVTHYSTWSPSNTSPSRTSPPRHLSHRTDNPHAPSSSFSALCPRQPHSSATPPPSWNKKIKKSNGYTNVTRRFLDLWERQKESEEMTQAWDEEPSIIYATLCTLYTLVFGNFTWSLADGAHTYNHFHQDSVSSRHLWQQEVQERVTWVQSCCKDNF